MSTFIILGGGFGDEGKGLVTDYLASQYPDPLVVRFSGGHQCGHTVVANGIRHVFANFGSGTLRGAPTYWSKYCTVEPIGLINELNILLEKLEGTDIKPMLYVDKDCPITTPYEIHDNHETEKHHRHGSCGVGFGKTFDREDKFYSLTFMDLFYPDILKMKFKSIKENFYHMYGDVIPGREEKFFNCCQLITDLKFVKMVDKIPDNHRSVIFEGSQGLLLDQHYGFFPNVTRSNTGTTNIFNMPYGVNLQLSDADIFLVTRAYQTRHGNGPMTNEDRPHNIIHDPWETNVENDYQGKFRRSLLDVSLLEYGMKKDYFMTDWKHKKLVITCLDHIVNEYRFTYKGEIVHCSNEGEFVDKVADLLSIGTVYISKSNDSKNIEHWRI